MGLVALRYVGPSRTRAGTHVPCTGRQILNHCTTKEAREIDFCCLNHTVYDILLCQPKLNNIYIYFNMYILSLKKRERERERKEGREEARRNVTRLGSNSPRFKSELCHELAVWPQTNGLIALFLQLWLVMLKVWPLCTGAKSNLRDRVLGEVEKNNFIVLSGKEGHSGLVPLKSCVSQPRGIWWGIL